MRLKQLNCTHDLIRWIFPYIMSLYIFVNLINVKVLSKNSPRVKDASFLEIPCGSLGIMCCVKEASWKGDSRPSLMITLDSGNERRSDFSYTFRDWESSVPKISLTSLAELDSLVIETRGWENTMTGGGELDLLEGIKMPTKPELDKKDVISLLSVTFVEQQILCESWVCSIQFLRLQTWKMKWGK